MSGGWRKSGIAPTQKAATADITGLKLGGYGQATMPPDLIGRARSTTATLPGKKPARVMLSPDTRTASTDGR